MSATSTNCWNSYMGYWLDDRRPGSGRWRSARMIMLTNWCYTKMASREIIIICIVYLIIIVYKKLSQLVDECWRYSKPKQRHFWAWLERPIFRVHHSQGSAATLVGRGGITNYHLIAISLPKIIEIGWCALKL